MDGALMDVGSSLPTLLSQNHDWRHAISVAALGRATGLRQHPQISRSKQLLKQDFSSTSLTKFGLSHTIKLTVVTSVIFLQRFLFLEATVAVLIT